MTLGVGSLGLRAARLKALTPALACAALVALPLSAAAGAGRAPVLLFMSGAPTAELPGTVAELRSAATLQLERAAVAAGWDTVGQGAMAPARRDHRVRSAWNLSLEFLSRLRDDTGADHLLVHILMVNGHRLEMLSRTIRLADGAVVWAGVQWLDLPRGEFVPQADPIPFYETLGRLCARSAPPLPADTAAAGHTILVLPTDGVACDPELTATATHAVLDAICADTTGIVIDPGVVMMALAGEGFAAGHLEAAGRRALAARWHDALLLAPEVLVYETAGYGAAAGDDGATTADALIAEYAVVLRLVDGRTGTITAGRECHRIQQNGGGWFGTGSATPVLQGLTLAARDAWRPISQAMEEHR